MTSLTEYLLRDRWVEHSENHLLSLGAHTATRFAPCAKVYLHLILSGTAYIRLTPSTAPIELHAGDYTVLLYGSAHTISTTPHQTASDPIPPAKPEDTPARLTLGPAPALVHIASTRLTLAHEIPARPATPVPKILPFLAHNPASVATPFGLDLAQLTPLLTSQGGAAMLQSLANLLLFHAIKCCHDATAQLYPVELGVNSAGTITSALRLMRSYPERPWCVASLAQEVGLSRSAFAAKFRAAVGTPPMDYLTHLRMRNAAELLSANKHMPLWEVGRRSGYETESSFSRTFKHHYGMSPRNYLQKMQQH